MRILFDEEEIEEDDKNVRWREKIWKFLDKDKKKWREKDKR